jgi:hypothetical protein
MVPPLRSKLIDGISPASSRSQTRGLPGRFRSITGSTRHVPGNVPASVSMRRMSDAFSVLLRCMVFVAPFILGDDSDGPGKKEEADDRQRPQECAPGRDLPSTGVTNGRFRGFGYMGRFCMNDRSSVGHARDQTTLPTAQLVGFKRQADACLPPRLSKKHAWQMPHGQRNSTPYRRIRRISPWANAASDLRRIRFSANACPALKIPAVPYPMAIRLALPPAAAVLVQIACSVSRNSSG